MSPKLSAGSFKALGAMSYLINVTAASLRPVRPGNFSCPLRIQVSTGRNRTH